MQIVAKTFQGLEEILAKELEALGASNINIVSRAVECEGDQRLLYRMNYELRTAVRVLVKFFSFKTKHENHLYKKIQEIDWSEHIALQDTFAIDATTYSKYLTHSKYLSLKVKDAIVDQLREKYDGQRPSIDLNAPTLRLQIHFNKDNQCTVLWDSSGQSLHKRGYRVASVLAPINEVLAAGLILLSGWKGDCPLIDPMCGSGTIPIEAAMYASQIPPQFKRKTFGFMTWKDFDAELWEDVRKTANAKIKMTEVPILGFDRDVNAVKIAEENIDTIGLDEVIEINWRDFLTLPPQKEKGVIIMNPPYDERLGEEDIEAFYRNIGDQLKKSFSGFDAWLISSNLEALKFIGLKPSRKIMLFNAALECRFQKYELYAGTKKIHKAEQ